MKHFKFEPRGKRRIHQKPRWSEIKACRPWLEAELDAISPRVIVTLGATAGQAVLGASFKLGEMRGRRSARTGRKQCSPTFHPSAVLRADAHGGGEPLFELIVEDLKLARSLLQSTGRLTGRVETIVRRVLALRLAASMMRMTARPSSPDTGGGVPSRMARSNSSYTPRSCRARCEPA